MYTAILGAAVLAMGVGLGLRLPFKVDVERDRGSLARMAEGGRIENVFRIQVMNAAETRQRFHISADGLPGLSLATEADIVVESTQSRWVPVRLQLPYEGAQPGSHPIHFKIEATGLGQSVTEKSVFIVPR
jgi:polyferredoxin